MPEQFLQRIIGAAERIKVKSALTPILWLCAITLPILILVVKQENPATWKIIISVAPVTVAVLGFLFLLIFDRNKLQSEEYQLNRQYMEMIEDKEQIVPMLAMFASSISKPQGKNGNLGDEE